jgi:hypothetical protein
VTPLNVLDNLADSLALATIDENWKHRVGRQTELRAKFNAPDLTVRQLGHFQIINMEGQEITIGSMATDEQIAAEIAKIRQTTEKPKMPIKLQGIASKMKLLQHNVELDAEKLSGEIDAAEARRQAVMPKASAAVASTQQSLGDVEEFINSVEAVTNGGPEL